jgi:hypothetical protein
MDWSACLVVNQADNDSLVNSGSLNRLLSEVL